MDLGLNTIERYDHRIFAWQYEYSEVDNTRDIGYYLSRLQGAGKILELACGTGRITIPLALSGIDIEGLDQAQEMVRIALKKSRDQGLEIRYYIENAVDFNIDRTYSAIFIPYNSISFIPEGRLLEFARNVSRHLEPQGRFLFDLSSGETPGADSGARHIDWSDWVFIRELSLDIRRSMTITPVPEKRIRRCTYFWEIRHTGGQIESMETVMEFSTLSVEDYIGLFRKNGFTLRESCVLDVGHASAHPCRRCFVELVKGLLPEDSPVRTHPCPPGDSP